MLYSLLTASRLTRSRMDEGYFIVRDTKNGNNVNVALAEPAVDAVKGYLSVRTPGKDAKATCACSYRAEGPL